MNVYSTLAPWTSRILILLSVVIFTVISVEPLLHPVASAASQGIAFTSPVGATIFQVSFAGLPLGCAACLACCLLSNRRNLLGLIFSALLLGVMLLVRIYGMEVDSSVQQSMPLVLVEAVLVAITLAGIAIDVKAHSAK